MKIRNGFVSNSSSSSFVVVLRPDAAGANELFDFFRTLAGTQVKIHESTVSRHTANLRSSKERLMKDMEWVEDRIKKLKRYEADAGVSRAVDLVVQVLSDTKDVQAIRMTQQFDSELIERAIKSAEYKKERTGKEIKKIEEKLAKYQGLAPETKVLEWNEDLMFGLFKDVVAKMEAANKLVIIESHTS